MQVLVSDCHDIKRVRDNALFLLGNLAFAPKELEYCQSIECISVAHCL